MIGWVRFFRYVTPKEHLDAESRRREGCHVHKIAAHAADLAERPPRACGRAPEGFDFRWGRSVHLTMDPVTARVPRRDAAADAKVARLCPMGPKFCSMELTRQVRDYAASHNLTSADARVKDARKVD
jgi:phosphomethylpyrimidine synthase